MTNRSMLGVVLALVAIACSVETAATTTTEVVAEPMTTVAVTTTVQSPSTTTDGVDICRRGLVWQPGVVYSARCFVLPVSFEVAGQGWGSAGGGEDWVRVRWQGEDRGLRVRVAVVEFRSTSPPEVVLDRIAGIDRIAEISVPADVVVAGSPGLMADFEGEPEPVGDTMPDPCTGDSPIWFGGTRFGHPILVTSGQDVIGVGACHVVRVWAVQTGDRTLTILGGTTDPARHAEAVAKIEELFEGMSFDFDGAS